MSVFALVDRVVAAARRLMPAAASAGLSVGDLDAALRALDAELQVGGSTECTPRETGLRVYASDLAAGRSYILVSPWGERQFWYLGQSDRKGAIRVRLAAGDGCVDSDWYLADCGLVPNREGARDEWWSKAWVMESVPSDERLASLWKDSPVDDSSLYDDDEVVL